MLLVFFSSGLSVLLWMTALYVSVCFSFIRVTPLLLHVPVFVDN